MTLRLMYLPAFLLLAFTISGSAQTRDALQPISRDSSFTVGSSATKIAKDFPDATPVVPAHPQTLAYYKDLVYATVGTRQLHLDLFQPKAPSGPRPAVLLIHGGGWSSGDHTMETPLAEQLGTAGFVTATVEYRLSPEARFPAAVHDLKSAVRWLRAHASDFNINASSIGVCGGSAGGHLAALLGTTNGDHRYDVGENLEYFSDVQAVVDIDGPLDLTRPEESGKDAHPEKPSAGKRWIGYSFSERPDLWREASPLMHAGPRTPPIAFINSAIERFHVGRDEMREILGPAHICTEVHTIPNTPHPFWLFRPWFDEVVNYVQAFFAKVLKE